jgi:protein SCO1/2
MSLKTARAFFISSILLVMFLPVTSGAVQKDPFGPEHAPFTPPEEHIGNSLSDFTFTDQDGKDFTLGEAFGRPLIISFIYTQCHHTCPIITSHLTKALIKAPEEISDFYVLTIGIDTANDTPSNMRQYGARFTDNFDRWKFLSADAPTIEKITGELGFYYEKTDDGFAHMNMVSLIDTEGRIYKHVYGPTFKANNLMGPLKEIAGIKPTGVVSKWRGFENLSFFEKVKLICSRYNPSTGTYELYYPYFIAMGFQVLAILVTVLIVWGKDLNSLLTRTVKALGGGG